MTETLEPAGLKTQDSGLKTAPFGAPELSALFAALGVGPHPILQLPSLPHVQRAMRTEAGRVALIEHLRLRQQRIVFAVDDPLNWIFEAETWADADRILLQTTDAQSSDYCYLLGIFGGNRAQKTWYAIKRAVETAILFPRSRIAICSESETASIATVQALTWYYIRRHYEHLNGKRHAVTSVNFSQKGGFTERKLIFPNGAEIYFLTYNQEAGDYEGWEFGAPLDVYEEVSARLKIALADLTGAHDAEFAPIQLAAWRAMGRTECPNIGAVCDESMPMSWLKMFSRRAKFRHAKVLWPFTPVRGITPAIKELVGSSAITLESRASELLPGQNFPELPKGHMPYIRRCAMTGARAIYFFSLFNKFGVSATRSYYEEIKDLCAGKTTEYIERVAYGFARDSIARAFPNFGPHNIVSRASIPGQGTNYFFFDPHGTRNFPMIWFRVVPERPNSIYIYREWPDVATYGEWAVPTEREVNDQQRKGWDGDPGPAQAGLGWGVVHYKLEILRLEKILVPGVLLGNIQHPTSNIEHRTETLPGLAGGAINEEMLEAILKAQVADQYHQRRIRQALRTGESLLDLHEVIAARFGDPRGIHNTHVSEQGGTTLYDEFEKENVDERTHAVVPPMELWDAPTSRRANVEDADEGITKVNELLGCPGRAVMPVFNQPHLFVSRDCQQVIWMLGNYTGRSGGTGASKDFADLVKYACLADLEHIEDSRPRGRAGKGW
jgi:hypothetical protein